MPVKPKDSKLVNVFASNVRNGRLARGWSQEELAEQAGVHRTYVGMLERAEKNVTIYNIERMAEALGTDAFKLLMP